MALYLKKIERPLSRYRDSRAKASIDDAHTICVEQSSQRISEISGDMQWFILDLLRPQCRMLLAGP